jgi:polyferredoxin
VDVVQIPADEMFEPEPVGPPWSRVGMMVFVLALACLAFFTKKAEARWVSLAATMVVLGWIDGGFLSISHVTGLVWVGFSAIGRDLPLLILTSFTVVTVVLWGRVFCGYMCPFGALQDFVERLVPRRFKRELPPGAHRAAWKVKYLILAVVVGGAILGVQVSLYQYVEPFGTVFFLSTNVLLWTIALAFLVASAVIPRFYCRYVCPLGALLAVGSLVSLRRIRRVEQCGHCHVCEQKCPTRAIRAEKIDFSECVRCNVCETQLIEKHGVCRHDMDEIRPRLVQIRRRHEALRVSGSAAP